MPFLVPALAVLLIAAALSNAPGAPMKVYFDEKRQTSSIPTSDDDFFVNDEGLVQFLGGDGATVLTGNIHSTQDHSPVVVMAQGLGLTAECGLEPFIEAFQEAGFAVFTFDYETLGASDGFPRHQVDPKRQVADLQAALRTVTKHADKLGVDGSRIILWGYSMGGAHSITCAVVGNNPSVRAMVALFPHLAGPVEIPEGVSVGTFLSAIGKIVLSLARSGVEKLVTGHPWYSPLVGRPGSSAFMQNPGDLEGYLSLTPKDGGKHDWKNAVTTSSLLRILPYRPLDSELDKIQIPSLLIAAEKDTLCPSTHIKAAAARIPKAELLMLKGTGHFDVFRGDLQKKVILQTIEFLKRHVHDVA